MIVRMYSVRDSKAEIFFPMFCKGTDAEAERDFRTACVDPKTKFSQFPEDFDLYYLGQFDDSTGKIQALDSPKHMFSAFQFAAKQGINVSLV